MRRYPAWGPEIIEIWNTKTEKSWKVHESKGPIYDLEFSPDNRYLVAVGGCAIDETVTPHGPSYAEIALYDLEKKKLVARTLLENHPFLYCCTFLPNGRDILALHQNNYEAAPEVIRIRIIETEKNPPAGKTESNFKYTR
ncbi:MAG: hypothetical protein H8E37_11490, partial [Planctomycetes bacterium]|nr:hypothetical protein [Planctomycetota bacterium]